MQMASQRINEFPVLGNTQAEGDGGKDSYQHKEQGEQRCEFINLLA